MNREKDAEKKSKSSTNEEEIRRLAEKIKEMPDMRQEKIDEIKKRIELGTYNVPVESVVESIVAHHKELTSKKSPKGKK